MLSAGAGAVNIICCLETAVNIRCCLQVPGDGAVNVRCCMQVPGDCSKY